MIVTDTSALISLASIDAIDIVLTEFDVHTTALVIEELRTTAEYDDVHGDAARTILGLDHGLNVHSLSNAGFESSRIDAGEASCAQLCEELDVDFFITDDLRALPELQNIVPCPVAISPLVLRALVKRNCLDTGTALEHIESMANNRSWLGAPIYRRAIDLFQD